MPEAYKVELIEGINDFEDKAKVVAVCDYFKQLHEAMSADDATDEIFDEYEAASEKMEQMLDNLIKRNNGATNQLLKKIQENHPGITEEQFFCLKQALYNYHGSDNKPIIISADSLFRKYQSELGVTDEEFAALSALSKQNYQLQRACVDIKMTAWNQLNLKLVCADPDICNLVKLGEPDNPDLAYAKKSPKWTMEKTEKILQILMSNLGESSEYREIHHIAIGRYISTTHPKFNGFEVSLKTGGAELGCILTHPETKERWFIKLADDQEYFVSLALAHLGVKYPESMMMRPDALIGRAKSCLLCTRDLGRSYQKNDRTKKKAFSVFGHIHEEAATKVLRKTDPAKKLHQMPDEDVRILKDFGEKYLGKSDAKTAEQQKLRTSLAKVLVCAYIFNLTDVGAHENNTGLITKEGSKDIKLGWVDFNVGNFAAYAPPEGKALREHIVKDTKTMGPLFQVFGQLLDEDDIALALADLQSPKERAYVDGMLLTTGQDNRTTFAQALENAVSEFEQSEGARKAKPYRNALEHFTQTMANLEHLIDPQKKVKKKG